MKNVLIVIDMQNDFISGTLGNRECQEVVDEVLKVLDNDYSRIYLTQDTHNNSTYMDSQEGQHLPVPHCDPLTGGWKIESSIAEKLSHIDVIKSYFNKDTFGSINLGSAIQRDYNNGLFEEIDVVGVCTGICVISNAIIIKSFSPELPINVIEKATACVTPQSKKTAIEAMKLLQINIK